MSKTIIDSKRKSVLPDWKEIYRFKDLFTTLAWRDFKVRYAQTTIGVLWAFIQPVATLLILHLVFGRFIGIETPVPHLVFTICGLSLWSYFSFVMINSGSSIISSQSIVKKIYFPRLIIPLSKAIVGLIDLAIALIILTALMIYYQIWPSANFWMAPLFILFGMIAALAIGIWLSALTVRYRDFQQIVPFMVQIGLYLTPVGYPAEFATKNLPNWASTLYYLNPMAGVVQGFRWCLFGGEFPGNLMFVSLLFTLILFISGLLYFRKIEDKMADLV